MQEKDRSYYQSISQLSISCGVACCIAAVAIGIMIISGNSLPAGMVFMMAAPATLPTLIGGFLLIMAGLILRAVTVSTDE